MTLTDEQIAKLTLEERNDLFTRLGGVRHVRIDVNYVRRIRRLRMGLMIPGTIILIPWTVYLATVLPVHYTAANWRLAWVGYDVVLLSLMAMTVVLGWRKRQLTLLTAFATGVMLLCDAWFDVTTASPADRVSAIASAFLAEIPLAVILIGGALRFVRLIAMQQGLITRETPLWRLRLPLVVETENTEPA